MKLNIVILLLFFSISASFAQHEQYPVPPKTPELLFYIQRNHNANTIVYDANFNADGTLNAKEPILVYWRRYDEKGQKMELRTVEKWYAYGVDWEKVEGKNFYKISLVADKNRDLWLKPLRANKAVVLTKINGKMSVLKHMYIFADNSGTWPTVEYIELFGYDSKTGKQTYEKIKPE